MRVRSTRQLALVDETGALLGLTPELRERADGDAFGVGDLLLRTKYRLLQGGPLSLAGALTLRVPTGEEENFQGLGDTTVTPLMVLEAPVGRHSVHGTAGFEVNAGRIERTRARYTVGASLRLLEQLAFLVDILGSSSLVDDEFDVPGLGVPVNGLDLVGLNLNNNTTTLATPQSTLIDLATGLKVALGPRAVFYVGAIIPLTDDGIRSDVIPTGGIEVGF
jgi:hypothetical protein